MGKTSKKSKKKHQNKLTANFLKLLREYTSSRNFTLSSPKQIMKALGILPEHKEPFSEALEKLADEGIIEKFRGRFRRKIGTDILTGTIRVHPRGFGFVQLQDTSLYTEDIFVPKHLTQNAVDGDQVEVEVNPLVTHPKGAEGRIVNILERSRTHVAGIIHHIDRDGFCSVYVPLLGQEKGVLMEPTNEFNLKVGDRLVMEVIDWGDRREDTLCKPVHVIGPISDPSCDIPAAVEEFELRDEFPAPVIKEAKKFGTRVSQKDIQGREDFRDFDCITIDPTTAKDFDDALHLKKDRKGHFHLGVHIADVSHYVKPGTALDDEANARANSVYFPGKCIPMLPGVLSENLCSLKANVNRLTVSVLMEFDKEGELVNSHITRGVIKSKKRFTYREAKQVIDGKKKSPHAPQLNLMVKLCLLLKKKRYERGSLEFALPELRLVIDEKGMPEGTELIEYDISHQLVEEFMLKANEVVAYHLDKKGHSIPFRVHEEPAEENLRDFAILAGAFGFQMPEVPTPKDIQKLFEQTVGSSHEQYLATSYIKRMRLAVYTPDNIGHYGLALTHYCHFTSPIRRYVDLVIHRTLFEGPEDELKNIAAFCSEQERVSSKAENTVILLKKLRLLKGIKKKEPNKQYPAVVTRVRNFGVYFEVLDYAIEGFLALNELYNDYYEFDEKKQILVGRHEGGAFHSGDRLTVMLLDVDLICLESKWALVT